MKEILTINGEVILVDDEDFEFLSTYRWGIIKGYAVSLLSKKLGETKPRIRMHRFVTKCPNGMVVDHINGNPLDNRKENLRICTQHQNLLNRRKLKPGYKGVYWQEHAKSWRAAIKYEKRRIHIGYFKNQKDAAEAYDKKAKELFGDFAFINFK